MSTRITRRKGSFTEAEKESTAECAVVPEKPVAPKAIEKVPITLVVDNSNEKIGIMHYLAMFIWLGWPSIYLTLMLTFPLLFLYARPVLMVIVIVLTTSAIYPIDIRKQPKWAMDFGASLMKHAPAYFKLRIYCEDRDAVLKCTPAMFAMEPHDILPVSIFSFSGILGYFPTHDCRGCLTSACFVVPGMRHIYTWGQAADVSKKMIQRNLSKGHSLAMCPGGAHEVCYMTDNKNKECVLYLRNRMGIVKMAAVNGVAIIPTFTFNQRAAFNFWIPQWRWLHKLGRRMGFIPLMFSGIWGIPYAMPAPTPLNLVVGKPIVVPKMEGTLTDEMLRPYLNQLIEAMERIFENNKAQFGMEKVVLKII